MAPGAAYLSIWKKKNPNHKIYFIKRFEAKIHYTYENV